MSSTPDKMPIPNELVHKILTHTIGDSIHSICMFTEPLQWDMDVIKILSAVSFNFQQIASEVAAKAFGISLPDDSPDAPQNIIPFVDKQLANLRRLGTRIRDQRHFEISSDQCVYNEGSRLVQAYFLYLAVIGLRRNATQTHDVYFFRSALVSIQTGLNIAVHLCMMARPWGIGAVLRRALECEVVFVRNGIVIVDACTDLTGALVNVEGAGGAADGEKATLLKPIHECLSKIEAAVKDLETINLSHWAPTEDRYSPFPGVFAVLSACYTLGQSIDDEKYWIRVRAGSLMQSCRFLEMTWTSYPWLTDNGVKY